MSKRIYRTAQGKMVDLGALQLRNENVRAVGNMGVNARGDLIDGQDQPIDNRNQRVARQYQRQTSNVTNAPVAGKKSPQATESTPVPPPPEDFDDNFVKETETKVVPEATAPAGSTGGLAAAIARARQVKQDPLKTQKELAKQQEGVRKI